MPDILIFGMKMPTGEPLRLVLNPNGQLFVDHGVTFTEYEAVELPEHGDLTDRDAIVAHCRECERNLGSDVHLELLTVHDWIEEGIVYDLLNAPVIVPSNKEETK